MKAQDSDSAFRIVEGLLPLEFLCLLQFILGCFSDAKDILLMLRILTRLT